MRTIQVVVDDELGIEIDAYTSRVGVRKMRAALRRLVRIGLNRSAVLAKYHASPKGKRNQRRRPR